MEQRVWGQMSGKASGKHPSARQMYTTSSCCYEPILLQVFPNQRNSFKKTEGTNTFCWLRAFVWICGYVDMWILLTTSCQTCTCAFTKRKRIPLAWVYTAFSRVAGTAEMHEEEKFIVSKRRIVYAGFKGRLPVSLSIYNLSTEGDICFIFLVNCHL